MRKFTEEELNFIKNNYTKMTDKEMGEHLNRTAPSISSKRVSLGYYKDLSPNKHIKKEKENNCVCEICKKEIYRKPSVIKNSKHIYCSRKCKEKGITLFHSGENHHSYNKIIFDCEWCGKEVKRKKSHYERNDSNFCGKECMQLWQKNVYSQTDESKERSRDIALNNLKNGVYKTDSAIQLEINKMLESLNIQFENEKTFEYYSVDNYIINENLIIEVNGKYWHTDPRFYDEINYDVQVQRIYKDRIKNKYIKNKYGIRILYLWEYDINNNQELCEELIKEYIKNKGALTNYHSFNYIIEDGDLKLSNDIIIPYSEYKKVDLDKIIDTTVKQKPEYYITFNCEMCGIETTHLIVKYNQSQHHFCSKICSGEYNSLQNRIIYNCDYCGKEASNSKAQYNAHKNHFCGVECHDKFQNTSVEKKCDNCNCDITVPQFKLKSNKHFFCSQSCDKEYKSNNFISKSEYISFNCDYCGKKESRLKSDYDKKKNHFCSVQCHDEFQRDPHLNGKWVHFNCDFCSTPVSRRLSSYSPDAPFHTCGHSCANRMRHRLKQQNIQ